MYHFILSLVASFCALFLITEFPLLVAEASITYCHVSNRKLLVSNWSVLKVSKGVGNGERKGGDWGEQKGPPSSFVYSFPLLPLLGHSMQAIQTDSLSLKTYLIFQTSLPRQETFVHCSLSEHLIYSCEGVIFGLSGPGNRGLKQHRE